MLSYQIYVHLDNRRTFQPQITDDCPAVWNYGKLAAKFLVTSIKVIDTVGFLSVFKSFTPTTIKIPLKSSCYCNIYQYSVIITVDTENATINARSAKLFL